MEQKLRVGVGFGIAVVRDGKVLLGRRHEDPAKADSEMHGEGTWTMPGGKLEFGETFEAGAARELAEETGLVAAEADFARERPGLRRALCHRRPHVPVSFR